MESLSATGKQRILYVDVARVIAILWIIGFWHLIEYSGADFKERYYLPAAKHITTVMLGLFMYHSGNLLGKKKMDSCDEIIAFYKNRLLRYYFLYVLSALLMYWIGKIRGIPQLVTTITATSTFILPQPLTLWFMSMLTVFYLLTPFIKKGILAGWSILLVLILSHLLIPNGIDDSVFWCYPLYMVGIYTIGKRKIDSVVKSRITLIVTLIVSVGFFWGAMKYWPVGYLLIVPGIIFLLSFSRFVAIRQIQPIVSIIAYCSLSAYLFHRPIYFFLSELFDLARIQHPFSVCVFVFLPVCLIISYIIQKAYDVVLSKVQK